MAEPIRIEGLREFQRGLRKMDKDLPKALRIALNEAAQIVVDEARPKVPRRTGRAAASIRVASTRTAARVREGGGRVPYMPWLDFGGRTGRNRSVVRPFYRQGRYVWRAVGARRDDITAAMEKALVGVAQSAGLEVD